MTKPEKPAEKPVGGPDEPAMQRRRQNANARARLIQRAADAVLREHGRISRRTPHGEVVIERVELLDEGGLAHIEVYAAPGTESGETHFRIFNPPTGVLRQDGEIVEDPLGALAEALGQFGGAQQPKRRRQR